MTKKLTTEQKLLNRIFKLRSKLEWEILNFQSKRAIKTQSQFTEAFQAFKKLTDLNQPAEKLTFPFPKI